MKHERGYIPKFVMENHRLYTQTEMAEKLGVRREWINQVSSALGVKCITQGERYMDFIEANPEMPKSKIAEHFGCTVQTIYFYEKNLNRKLFGEKEKIIEKKCDQPSYNNIDDYINKYRSGYIGVAALVVAGMTAKEKELFAEKGMIRY